MSTEITPIYFSRLKNETHVQFHENVITLVGKITAEKLDIKQLYQLYIQAFDKEKETLLIIRKSELTEQISEQDIVRDEIFKGFSTTVKAFRSHYAPEYRVAANRLWSIFVHYGNMSAKTLDNQTAAVNDILRELDRQELYDALKVLDLMSWKKKLEEENRKFHELMMARYNEAVGKTTLRMKTTRIDTDKYYRAIAADLENKLLLGFAADKPYFTDFIAELNAIIKRFKNIMAQEFGRKNKFN